MKKKTPETNQSFPEPINILKHSTIQKFLWQFDFFLKKHIESFYYPSFKGQKLLWEAMRYSLFSGGKYFRPILVFATAQLVSIKSRLILPWAAAIEMIHTASLIHDDLPCMDNSLYRRGKTTCHRKFGEDIALLAGDCLWIEAFRLLSLDKRKDSTKIWPPILCQAAGFNGLMGGQALDLKVPMHPNESYYKKMHSLKTGALIVACMEGVVALKHTHTQRIQKIRKAAPLIGQAFQLADDLQDAGEKEIANFVNTLGRKKALKHLQKLSNNALELIDFDTKKSNFLKELIIFNQNRIFT